MKYALKELFRSEEQLNKIFYEQAPSEDLEEKYGGTQLALVMRLVLTNVICFLKFHCQSNPFPATVYVSQNALLSKETLCSYFLSIAFISTVFLYHKEKNNPVFLYSSKLNMDWKNEDIEGTPLSKVCLLGAAKSNVEIIMPHAIFFQRELKIEKNKSPKHPLGKIVHSYARICVASAVILIFDTQPVAACSCFCKRRAILRSKSKHKCMDTQRNRSIRIQFVTDMGYCWIFWQ